MTLLDKVFKLMIYLKQKIKTTRQKNNFVTVYSILLSMENISENLSFKLQSLNNLFIFQKCKLHNKTLFKKIKKLLKARA